MKLNERKTATVLAALRLWQETKNRNETDLYEIATDGETLNPLSDEEIDALCERINDDDPAIDLLRSVVDQWAGRFASEEDINGADAVDWLGEFVDAAKAVLEAENGEEAEYTLEGEPCDIEEFIKANAETLTVAQVAEIRSLQPGEDMLFGGGAWAAFILKRVDGGVCVRCERSIELCRCDNEKRLGRR